MPIFESILAKTDVTCIKLCNSVLLLGIGGQLHIFDEDLSKPKAIINVFHGQKIYGIVPNCASKHCLVYGANCIKTFIYNFNMNYMEELVSCKCDDWILEAKWLLPNNIVTVHMHNIVILWTAKMEQITKIYCEEKCLLYCAHLANESWNNLIVLSGTVFSEVLIWTPHRVANKSVTSPVLYRLKGHKGVIFSIDYNLETGLICSTSDDRIAILWCVSSRSLLTELGQSTIKITEKCKLHGHNARVFKCKVLKSCVLTAGEDSVVNIWSLEGKLLRKLEFHQGACIWSLDYDIGRNIVVTGGGDCGVTLFSLAENIINKQITLEENQTPKKLAILKNNDFVVIFDNGSLYYYCLRESSWNKIGCYEAFQSYSLLEVSLCRNYIALAGYLGTIHVYKQTHNGLNCLCRYQIKDKCRIFAFHWLSLRYYLTCGPAGLMSLWILDNDNSPFFIRNFQLPPSKEQWTTAACLSGDKFIIVGDRKGNIYLYSFKLTEPVQIIRKAHNYLGVTSLYFKSNELTSMGRNSVLKRYHFDHVLEQLSIVSTDKLPFNWLAKLSETNNVPLLQAFMGDDFILWDYKKRRTLWQLQCGGGHRSWDFYTNSDEVYFIYIKDKQIHLTQSEWNSLCPHDVVSGYHISEINSASIIFNLPHGMLFIITGGEDTTLRISNVDLENNTFSNISILKSHLSSIRVVTAFKYEGVANNNEHFERNFLISAGGRGQIILWEIEGIFDVLKCNEKCSYYQQLASDESEIRIMDLVTIVSNDSVILIVACSDGTLKIFLVNLQHDNFKFILIGNVKYKLKCILKVACLEVCGRCVVLSMATDGKMAFWDFTNLLNTANIYFKNTNQKDVEFEHILTWTPFKCLQVHQSGINSFCCRMINNDNCLFLSGGDDNAIVFNLVKFIISNDSLDVEVLSTFCDVASHCAQITGVFLTNNFFLTTSIDQKLNVFQWSIKNDDVLCGFVQKYNSCIADIQGMNCFHYQDVIYAFLYGKGVELCKIDMELLNKINEK